MGLFKKLQAYFGEKPSVENVVKLLQESLEELSDQLFEYHGTHERSVHRRVQAAARSMKDALAAMETDTDKRVLQKAKAGLVHLHIARLLASGKDFEKIEIRVSSDTIEGALFELTEKLAKVKLLVEYGDLTIDPSIQESLLNVMKIFDSAVADLKKRHTADAKRALTAASVALHAVVCNVEASNQHENLAALKVTREMVTESQWRACKLASKIAECRQTVNALQKGELPDVLEHLNAAEDKFANCLDNLVVGDESSIAMEARAGMLEIQSASRIANDAEFGSERRQNSLVRTVIAQFHQDVRRVVRLTESLNVETDGIARRLDASCNFFVKAHKCLHNDDLNEAERLARAAHLDLDFAWQIANCRGNAQYREEL
ncbi:MAG TPA: hypothetical protein V6C97_07220 [Oculatellaceae cyanobacterium]